MTVETDEAYYILAQKTAEKRLQNMVCIPLKYFRKFGIILRFGRIYQMIDCAMSNAPS